MTPMPLGVAVTERLPIQGDGVATMFLTPCGGSERGAVGISRAEQLANECTERRCVCRVHVA